MENGNAFDEMRRALRQAELVNRAVDQQASALLELIVGRLRHAKTFGDTNNLRALKRELRDFDAVTGRWKPLGDRSAKQE
jgi:hypothetical protein